MNKAAKEKKLLQDAYTVESPDGARYRIRPVTDGFLASTLCEYYYSTTREQPETLEDGSRVYYDGRWFFIRDYGDGKQMTIAILTAT